MGNALKGGQFQHRKSLWKFKEGFLNNPLTAIEKTNLPNAPSGFKRELYLKRDYSKMDAYYFNTGKRLRSLTEMGNFNQQNPEFSDLPVSDFSFFIPKVMDDTIPSTTILSNSNK
ncbi:Methyl-CpG-binding domain-containing protein 4 [Capsicum annuum]|nr:Methyl-CpG-binding domain-containing protein 4 [Capsicum annuum]